MRFKKILYPTDFSELSLYALGYAIELATEFGGEIHCLHVVDESGQYWMGTGETAVPMVMSFNDLQQSLQSQMDDFVVEHFKDISVPIVNKVITGPPFLEIIRYARQESIDLIVIATHGRGALASVLLGSVAERVVRKSPCPVLTVRHPDHKFVMP